MTFARATLALLLFAAVGCEQESQELPFGPESPETVARTIGPEGGTISTPAGLSLVFGSGSLAQPTEITVLHRGGDDVGANVDGTIIGGTVFDVGPSGAELGAPARLSLEVPRQSLDAVNPRALTGVVVSGAERRYLSDASVDLTSGILKTDLPRLGTVAVRISDDVVSVGSGSTVPADRQRIAAAFRAPVGANSHDASFTFACGDDGQPACSTTDAIDLTLSQELHDAINGCIEFIDPVISIDVTIQESSDPAVTGRASGTVAFSGTVKYQTGSDGTACGSGSGSVQSMAVDDTFSLGTASDPWTDFVYDPATQRVTFARTSDGQETLDCDCGGDIFAASQIRVGQTSEQISFEGLTGTVSWAVRLTGSP